MARVCGVSKCKQQAVEVELERCVFFCIFCIDRRMPPERKVRGMKHHVKTGERDQTAALMPAPYLSDNFNFCAQLRYAPAAVQTQGLLMPRINLDGATAPGYYGTPV